MTEFERLLKLRRWFPIPGANGQLNLSRWFLLEADRHAVTAALLSLVFLSLMLIGTIWTFKMQRILVETPAVQTILTTMLSGIILLVSIVVSINSIVLSHDITSVETQEDRIESVMEFRQRIGQMTETGESPVNPSSYWELMAEVILQRAKKLEEIQDLDSAESELVDEIEEYVESIENTMQALERGSSHVGGAEFGVLWEGLRFDYGEFIDRSDSLQMQYNDQLSDSFRDQFEEVGQAFKLFAIGKEYFNTLYYSQEISELSRTLLFISLPAILVNASAILAINAGLLPNLWIFGLPPLLTFVAFTFTISLAPFVVLTAYMLRLATVARETAVAGPFSLNH
jgi:hypothetical protein